MFLVGITATAASIALGAIFGEFGARWRFKKNVESLAFSESDLYYYYDPMGYRHNLPGKTGYERMWNDQGRAEFRINSLGFRGAEPERMKPSGVFRVLFLGDSITLGGRLPEDATFVERVHQALDKASPKHFDVANAGVGDVGLMEEEQTLHTSGLDYRPDLVVLCWYLNDARPPVGFPEEVVYKNGLIRWFNAQGWLKKSYLAGFLYDVLRQSLVAKQMSLMDSENRRFGWTQDYMAGRWQKDPEAFTRVVHEARFDWGDAWNDKSLAWMAAKIPVLRDFAAAHKMRFAVVMLPVHAQVYAEFGSSLLDRPQRQLAEALKAAGIPAFDLLDALRPRKAEPLFYDQCHYTPHGNEVVAGAILGFLKTSGLLPK